MKQLALMLLLFAEITCFGQNMINPEVTSEYNDEKGQWTYYVNNINLFPITMQVSFNHMENVSSSIFSNHHLVIPARQKIICFRLTKNNLGALANWEYKCKYYTGNVNAKHKHEIAYFLPLAPGKKITVKNLISISERFKNSETADSLIACQFLYAEGDTVRACRKGEVCEIEEGFSNNGADNFDYKRDVNFILVVQPDQTFARYKIFKQGEIFVEPGETIYPGTPLGLAGGHDFRNGCQMRFMVYKPVKLTEQNITEKHYWEYFRPNFIVDKGEISPLEYNKEYVSVHPEELITVEMNRREKKKWLKNNQ